jgi:hypothetical protein
LILFGLKESNDKIIILDNIQFPNGKSKNPEKISTKEMVVNNEIFLLPSQEFAGQ